MKKKIKYVWIVEWRSNRDDDADCVVMYAASTRLKARAYIKAYKPEAGIYYFAVFRLPINSDSLEEPYPDNFLHFYTKRGAFRKDPPR